MAPDGNGERADVLAYRVNQQGASVQRLEVWRQEVDAERARRGEQMTTLDGRMSELTEAVDALRKALIGFALSIAGAAVIFALSILAATGKL